MQAFRKPSPFATPSRSASPSRSGPGELERQSPEQNASAASGAYFKAVRPTVGEAAAVARGETVVDGAKLEGLRFELDVGIWRSDSERVSRCLIDDAADFGDED